MTALGSIGGVEVCLSWEPALVLSNPSLDSVDGIIFWGGYRGESGEVLSAAGRLLNWRCARWLENAEVESCAALLEAR